MFWVVLVVLELISVACLVHLWMSQRGAVLRRAVWSFLVLIPLIGPLVYGSLYHPPSSNSSPSQMESVSGAASHDGGGGGGLS